MEEGGAHVGPPDCRASVPTHRLARGYAMPGFYDAAAADSPTAERLLALGHLSQLSQTCLGQAGLAHPHPRTASGQGVVQT